jgi:uncharacterized repeat protein (TIGR02543 family)/LPXTG-motif cell wall-anchored protein
VNRRLPAGLVGVLALTSVLVLGNGTAAFAATVTGTVGDYSYTADDADIAAGATVTSYDTSGGLAANIPSSVTLGGQLYAVTGIGTAAFEADNLASVTIPDSVTTIGDFAFYDDNLTSVVFPDSLISIGDSAFYQDQLTTLTIPDSVTTVALAAFSGDPLTSLTIGDSVTTIDGGAFGDNDLTSVTIPDSVTYIGVEAFADDQLASVTLGDSVATIDDSAFARNHLTSVTIPGSVTTIVDRAFESNPLTSVTIGDSVTTVGDGAFFTNSGSMRVEFLGAAPTNFGSASGGKSLGNAAGVTVYYNWAFDAAQVAGGFTTPTWEGYATVEQATVAFDSSGHGTAPADQDVAVGSAASKPADPTAGGYIFTGWYTSPALSAPVNFSDPITANTTYYAGWSTLATTGVTISPLTLPLVGLALVLGLALILFTQRKRNRARRNDTAPPLD